MRSKFWAITLLALVLFAPACATVKTNPTPDDQAAVRAKAQDASAGIRTGLGIADQTGAFLATLPLSTAVKDDYDCAIVKVTGTRTPRPALLKVCGPSTPQGPGPLDAILEKLKAVTTNPSLTATLTETRAIVEPLVKKLEASDQPALRAFGVSLRVAFVLVLGGQ